MRKRSQAGFTLVEMLIVIAVIALLAGLAMPSVGGDATRQARAEAERLRAALQLAADEALFANAEIGVSLGAHAYGFLRYDAAAQRWLPLEDKPFKPYTLPGELALALTAERRGIALPKDELPDRPALVFLSTGEMTPFVLSVTLPSSREAVAVGTDGVGPIELLIEEKI